jgi:endonuclease/exonuclease/phosphatase family metal-dependent hydrolase
MAQGTVIRIVSWNVHGFVDRRGRFSPEASLRVLEELEPDIVALQEVEDRRWRGQQSLHWLADRGGWNAWVGSTLLRGDSRYGNAILANFPATRLTHHDLTVHGSKSEPRGLIEIEFSHRRGPLRLLATHLGLGRRERQLQLKRLLRVLGEPVSGRVDVLAGDFNEWLMASKLLTKIHAAFDVGTRGRTFPARRPLFALDRIWIRPGSRFSGSRVARLTGGESDHLPTIIELTE